MDGLCQCCHRLFQRGIGQGMGQNSFVYIMRLIVVALNLIPMYSVNYEILEWMENDMDKLVYKFLLNFFIIMSLLSYLTASLK
mmetsp:Transcript_5375/g.8310  ORF Transcript_5375/g.8310 Transcript_5375/m.8310 type:complete len:83 (+) Transcript_5375:6-254(+)